MSSCDFVLDGAACLQQLSPFAVRWRWVAQVLAGRSGDASRESGALEECFLGMVWKIIGVCLAGSRCIRAGEKKSLSFRDRWKIDIDVTSSTLLGA